MLSQGFPLILPPPFLSQNSLQHQTTIKDFLWLLPLLPLSDFLSSPPSSLLSLQVCSSPRYLLCVSARPCSLLSLILHEELLFWPLLGPQPFLSLLSKDPSLVQVSN